MAEGKDNVKVAIRVRPLSDKERREMGGKTCLTVEKEVSAIVLDARPEVKTFTFDYVADLDIPQSAIFEQVGKPITSSCLSGYNGTIFAYGQTGAGKTYTILGPESDLSLEDYENSEQFQERGLMPRCVEHIFSDIGKQTDQDVEYLIKASFLEIYQEQVIDLLSGAAEGFNLQLREDLKRGVYVEGLIEEIVGSVADTYELLRTGTCNRHVGATSMNKESSRSHSVFTLTIESKETREGVTNFRSSRFHIIDLAGSERQRSTDAIGERLREAGMINKSLSALGNVINSLVDIAEGKSRHVHYRDSKLTFLLKDSLGGNSKTYIVANISPSSLSFGETLSTLKFAQRAKMIRNKAIVNEDTAGSVHLLKEEIKRLKEELASAQEISLLAIQKCPKCAGLMEEVSENQTGVSSERVMQVEKLLEMNTKLRLREVKSLEEQLETKEKYIKSMHLQVGKLEKKISNDKMVLKFRDSTISRLQSGSKIEDSEELETAKQEINLLREQLEGSTSAAKLFIENERLKDELATLHKELMEEPESVLVRLRENQDYTEQVVEWLNEDVETREKAKMVYEEYKKYESGEEIPENVRNMHQTAVTEMKLEFLERIQQLEEQVESLQASNQDQESTSRKRLEQQAKRIEEMAADNAFLTRKCEELMAVHVQGEEQLTQEIASLTDNLATVKVDLETQKNAVLTLEDEKNTLKSQYLTVISEKKAIENELSEMQKNVISMQNSISEMTKMQEIISDFERILRVEQTKNKEISEELDKKTAELTVNMQELEVLQEDNRFTRNQREELEAEVKDLKDENEELEAVNEELTSTIKEQEDQINSLISEKTQVEKSLLEMEKNAKETEIERNKQENCQISELKQKFEITEKSLFESENRLKSLEKLANDAKSELVEKESEIEDLKSVLQMQETALANEQRKNTDKETALITAETRFKEEIENAKKSEISLQSEILSLKEALKTQENALKTIQNHSNSDLEEKETALKTAENRIKELEEATNNILETFKQETGALRELINIKEQNLETANRQIATFETDFNRAKLEITELKSEFSSRENQYKERILTLELDIKSTEGEAKRLEIELETSNQRIISLENQYLSEKLMWEKDLQAQELALMTEREAASKDLDALGELEQERNNLEGQIAELQGEIADMRTKIRSKDSLIESLKRDFDRVVETEKSAKATIVESLEAEERLREENHQLKSLLETRGSEVSKLSDALSAAMSDVESLRSEVQEGHVREKELMHRKAELEVQIQAGIEESEGVMEEKRKLEGSVREKDAIYEQKMAGLAEHIVGLQRSLEQYQQMLAAAEQRAADLANHLDPRISELQSALETAQSEAKTLREDNKSKLEILQNTNRNILSTRQEIEMWKKCIEEKNETLHQLRHSLRKAEEEKAQLLQGQTVKSKPCGHESELQYIKSVLERREKELFELKEKGQLYYAQADEAIESQRKEIEMLNKRCAAQQTELTKCREELRGAEERKRHRSHDGSESDPAKENDRSPLAKAKLPPRKDEVLLLKTQIVRLREEVSSKTEQIEALQQLMRAKGRNREDEASLRDHYEHQIESLSSGLNRITEYVFSLPIVSFNPEETGIVESTIKAIASVYESYEAKCREQSKVRPQVDSRGEVQTTFGSNYVNPANYKNPVAHYHALLNSSSIKPGQLLSPGHQHKSPFKGKKS